MSIGIERLTAADNEEVIDFLDLVFSQEQGPHELKKVLPKAALPDEEHMSRYLAVRERGRIRALLGVYPMPTQIGGERLLFSTVGNVTTHIEARGAGYMRALMGAAMDELARIGADASRLHGLRSRYNRYGFECAGTAVELLPTARNVRETYGSELPALRFVPLESVSSAEMEQVRALYRTRRISTLREGENDFLLALKAWRSTPYAAFSGEELIGYFTASADKCRLTEPTAATPALLRDMAAAWLGQNALPALRFNLAPTELENLPPLCAWCESFTVTPCCNFKILNWVGLAGALLRLKHSLQPLPEGEFVLEIAGWGRLALWVGETAGCARTQAPAALTLDPLHATRFLFGPLPPAMTAALPAASAALLGAWLPLPLFWSEQDSV